jgi:hypothetical protein
MKKVIIIVPIYKIDLSDKEKVALEQVEKILWKYPICFIIPEKLNLHYQGYPNVKIEAFNDTFFNSTHTYSELLMSELFYERFRQYTYMLIYQLDAFVFSDRLEEFCALAYDYIGAPMPKNFPGDWHNLGASVGNGGFSLRKIESVLSVVKIKEQIYLKHPMEKVLCEFEDLFFSYCGICKNLNFHVPDISIALTFSIQENVRKCYNTLDRKLPFGCHAWYNNSSFDIWKPIIEKYGYILDDYRGQNFIKSFKECRYRRIYSFLLKRILLKNSKKIFCKLFEHILNKDCKYGIWGYGKDGKRCIDLFNYAEMNVSEIYDSNAVNNYFEGSILIKKPIDTSLKKRKNVIIIATQNYEDEIAYRLERLGLREKKDFLFFGEIEESIVRHYYMTYNNGKL